MHSSDHKRDVDGMHEALRCGAQTASGKPCRSPAIRGTRRCHAHTGDGASGKSRGRRTGDYAKANLVREQKIVDEIKRLTKLIRKMRGHGVAAEFITELETMGRNLLNLTQQKEADLAAAFMPSPAEPQPPRDKVERVVSQGKVEEFVGTTDQTQDRALGAMLGLAVGEALGMVMEGSPRDSYRQIDDMLGGGRTFDLEPGEWAGSTASALALMDSLTQRNAFDERHFMSRLRLWEEGCYSCIGECIGMDNDTRQALAKYRETNDPVAGDRNPKNVSCGSLVRVAPVAVRHWNDRSALLEVAERQSRVTHGSPAQIEACRALADMMAVAIKGNERLEVLRERFVPGAPSMEGFYNKRWHKKEREQISSNDDVWSALGAAVWCLYRADDFNHAVLLAANLGEAASVVAAITGQLAGSYFGASKIRASWLELLADRDDITTETEALFKLSRPSV